MYMYMLCRHCRVTIVLSSQRAKLDFCIELCNFGQRREFWICCSKNNQKQDFNGKHFDRPPERCLFNPQSREINRICTAYSRHCNLSRCYGNCHCSASFLKQSFWLIMTLSRSRDVFSNGANNDCILVLQEFALQAYQFHYQPSSPASSSSA